MQSRFEEYMWMNTCWIEAKLEGAENRGREKKKIVSNEERHLNKRWKTRFGHNNMYEKLMANWRCVAQRYENMQLNPLCDTREADRQSENVDLCKQRTVIWNDVKKRKR